MSEIEKIASESLDVTLATNQDLGKRTAPGRAAIPSPGSSGNLRTRIWDNLERLFQDTLYTHCLQVIARYSFDENAKVEPDFIRDVIKKAQNQIIYVNDEINKENKEEKEENFFD